MMMMTTSAWTDSVGVSERSCFLLRWSFINTWKPVSICFFFFFRVLWDYRPQDRLKRKPWTYPALNKFAYQSLDYWRWKCLLSLFFHGAQQLWLVWIHSCLSWWISKVTSFHKRLKPPLHHSSLLPMCKLIVFQIIILSKYGYICGVCVNRHSRLCETVSRHVYWLAHILEPTSYTPIVQNRAVVANLWLAWWTHLIN